MLCPTRSLRSARSPPSLTRPLMHSFIIRPLTRSARRYSVEVSLVAWLPLRMWRSPPCLAYLVAWQMRFPSIRFHSRRRTPRSSGARTGARTGARMGASAWKRVGVVYDEFLRTTLILPAPHLPKHPQRESLVVNTDRILDLYLVKPSPQAHKERAWLSTRITY